MTTRKPSASGQTADPADEQIATGERITRPYADRIEADRSGGAARAAASDHGVPPPSDGPGAAINEAVADAVKSSYDVLAETIAQGRKAAERFRHGEYSVREVPQDVEAMAMRLLDLARQVSTTSFDICENLLRVLAKSTTPPPPGSLTPCPPFSDPPMGTGNYPPPAGDTHPSAMPLQVRFNGTAKARSLTDRLARPMQPTVPYEIHVLPLAPLNGTGAPIAEVQLEADLMGGGGLIATITVPAGQLPGTYAGFVVAKGQTAPLGSLVIELEE